MFFFIIQVRWVRYAFVTRAVINGHLPMGENRYVLLRVVTPDQRKANVGNGKRFPTCVVGLRFVPAGVHHVGRYDGGV